MQINVLSSKEIFEKSVFDKPFNEALVHQVIVACMSNKRQGTHQQKTRAEVSGGGIKPWRQKGTGRARAGTIRSPIWRHGGKTFAARPGIYDQKINKKMYAGAMLSIISQLIRDDRLMVVEDIKISSPKTKLFADALLKLNVKKALIIVDKIENNLALAVRNLIDATLMTSEDVTPIDLLSCENVVITNDAFKKLNGVFSYDK